MILHIEKASIVSPHSIDITFSNGVSKLVDVTSLLSGPIFEPLKDPSYFSQMTLDHEIGTVVWPNSADFAPEALLALPDTRPIDSPVPSTEVG